MIFPDSVTGNNGWIYCLFETC